jgi:hypothetical protein
MGMAAWSYEGWCRHAHPPPADGGTTANVCGGWCPGCGFWVFGSSALTLRGAAVPCVVAPSFVCGWRAFSSVTLCQPILIGCNIRHGGRAACQGRQHQPPAKMKGIVRADWLCRTGCHIALHPGKPHPQSQARCIPSQCSPETDCTAAPHKSLWSHPAQCDSS